MRDFDDFPRRGRLQRLRGAVEGTPLDVVVKWAVTVVAGVYALEFVLGTVQSLWQTIARWVF